MPDLSLVDVGWSVNELLSESWTLGLPCPKTFPKDLCSVFTILTFCVSFSVVLQSYNRKTPFLWGLNLMCNISSLPCTLPPLELFSSVDFICNPPKKPQQIAFSRQLLPHSAVVRNRSIFQYCQTALCTGCSKEYKYSYFSKVLLATL